MNLLLFEKDEVLAEGRVLIGPHRRRAVLERHTLEVGRTYTAGIVDGPLGVALVTDIGTDKIELEFLAKRQSPSFSSSSLILAAPRPQMFKRILEAAGSLGIERIIIVSSERSQKSYISSHSYDEAEMRYRLWLGLEQAMVTCMPEVLVLGAVQALARQIDDLFPEDKFIRLLAATGAQSSLTEMVMSHCRSDLNGLGMPSRHVFAIGPESGWSEEEEELFVSAMRFHSVSLGDRVLRVETAVYVTFAQLQLLNFC
ncbi:MAG: RsmE family RNA methyltransferase [bacterium]|nr:RsmE family RNA methyltransferase [bacterium]